MSVALAFRISETGVGIWANASATCWDSHVPELLVEAAIACHRTWSPRSPLGKHAIPVTGPCCTWPGFLNCVAWKTAVPWLDQDGSCMRLETTATFGSAPGPTRPCRHVTIDWAMVLSAALVQ